MTEVDKFRSNQHLTQGLRALLADPVMEAAMLAMDKSNPIMDVPLSADPIESVRMLSQLTGYNSYPAILREMTTPLQPPVEIVAEFKPET